jgi:hypothetical protein
VWFGVLLCVNLQTSFMHPPFGFALFYLRGIADTLFKEKRIPVAVKSNDIYLGSIPWVIMQLMLVIVVIFVPQTVTAFLDKDIVVDIDKVQIEMPTQEVIPAAEIPMPGVSSPEAGSSAAADKAAEDEQKNIEELFKNAK